MTDHLVLAVEGKRTGTVLSRTSWLPGRNQLVRNLEAVGEVPARRACGVLLVGEEAMPELDKQTYELSLPHLGAEGRERVMSRYLGQITWRGLCDASSASTLVGYRIYGSTSTEEGGGVGAVPATRECAATSPEPSRLRGVQVQRDVSTVSDESPPVVTGTRGVLIADLSGWDVVCRCDTPAWRGD